jgi:LmbE family N-acetylglucosaminyl deacetylase
MKIIVVSAHPDDEIIGCGGTLLKHKKAGDEIYWLIITNVSVQQGFSEERVSSRQKEIAKVAEMMGFSETIKLDYPTMSLSSSSLLTLIPKVSDVFSRIKPERVYVMNRSDAHSDHRFTFDAVMACTKSFRYPFIKTVMMYECLSETEFAPALPERVFIPNSYVDVSMFFKRKLEVMKVYESELAEHPFPRSIRNMEAQAVMRGATAGVEYAEAFQVILNIDK